MGRRRERGLSPERISELLPGHEELASRGSYEDGDTWPIFPGRLAEYDEDRGALIVLEHGKEIGFIPVFTRRRG